MIYMSGSQTEKAHQLQIEAISYKKGKTSMENTRTQSEDQRGKENVRLQNDFERTNTVLDQGIPLSLAKRQQAGFQN